MDDGGGDDERPSCIRTCTLRNVHGETETTVDRGVKGERALSPSLPLSRPLSFPLARYASLFLLFRRAASPLLRPFLSPATAILLYGPIPLLRPASRLRSFFLERSQRTRTRNKKVIGSRYKGKFLREFFNGNSDFSSLPSGPARGRFLPEINNNQHAAPFNYRPIIAKYVQLVRNESEDRSTAKGSKRDDERYGYIYTHILCIRTCTLLYVRVLLQILSENLKED